VSEQNFYGTNVLIKTSDFHFLFGRYSLVYISSDCYFSYERISDWKLCSLYPRPDCNHKHSRVRLHLVHRFAAYKAFTSMHYNFLQNCW